MYLICGEALFDCFPGAEGNNGALNFEACAGGSPFNVAIGLALLGGDAALLTGISTDMFGRRLVHMLEREGVDTGYLIRSPHRTTLVVVGLDAGVRLVVVTDGGAKVTGWLPDQDPVRVTPPRIKIVDTVGAGDTFQAALLARLSEHGKPADVLTTLDRDRLAELLSFAATAASITCSRRGADLPSRSEVIERLANDIPSTI